MKRPNWWNERGAISPGEGLALKVVSLLLALILWITILGFKQEELKVDVKLEPLLAPNMMITNKIPSFIQFVMTGPRVLLKDVQNKLQPIRPDLRATPETTIGLSISDDLLGEMPRGVKVISYFPPNVLIRLEQVIERYVEVKPIVNGQVAKGYEISSVRATPSKVAVLGPKTLFSKITSVGTDTFDVTGLAGSKEGVIPVKVDTNQGFRLSRERVVRVRVHTRQVLEEETNQ